MAFVIKDRVKEGTTTTGTGDITLSGAAATFQAFSDVMSNGDTTYYAIVHTSSGVDEWEVGIGTFNTGGTLSRTTILESSNSDAAVNFSGGTKNVFMTQPADKVVYKDASGNLADVSLSNLDTDDLSEGATNQYYTDARAQAAITGGTGVTVTAGQVAIGQSVGTSDSVTFSTVNANLTGNVTGDVTGNADTATTLETARTIAGQSFDGSANISIAATDLSDTNQALSTTSNVTFNNITSTGTVTLAGDPTSALQAATKEYVDTIATAGIHYHTPVRVETPSNLNATYNNGSSGVGATLTNAGTQAALVIDGVTLNSADRVLVYNQTNAAHNGIYTVTDTGSASTNWVLTRATDADSYGVSDPDAFGEGDAFFVKEGATGAGELYVMNTAGTITFGTTAISFTVIAETAVYTAGTDITLDGTTFNLNPTIAADTTGSAATLTTARTISLTGDVSGSTSFDGSGNVSITATVADDSHNHVTGNIDGFTEAVQDIVGGMVSGNTESGISVTYDDAGNSLDFNVNDPTITLTGAVTGSGTMTNLGNVSIATTATADPTLTLSGDVTGSATFTNLGNATLTATVANDSHTHDGRYYTETESDARFATAAQGTTADAALARSGGTMTGAITFAAGQTFDGRDVSADGAKLDGIESGATADQTASEILTAIKTVDGSGSGLDADTLDGVQGSSYLRSDTNDTFTGQLTVQGNSNGQLIVKDNSASGTSANPWVQFRDSGNTDLGYVGMGSTGSHNLYLYTNSGDPYMGTGSASGVPKFLQNGTEYTMWHSGNDGSGSGLDADLWDGNQFSNYLNQAVKTDSNPVFNTVYVSDRIYHNGDTDTSIVFGTNEITMQTGGSNEVTVNSTGVRLGDSGNGYFQPVSSDYGSIQIDGGAHNSWEGYNIGGRAVFMHNNSTTTGIFNDVENDWLIKFTHNGQTDFYANGSNEARLESDGDFHADGNIIAYSTTVSDPRLKENIQPVTNGLEKVMKLNGYTFDYKADGVASAGVMSPEVKEVLPSAIKKSKLTLKLGDDNQTEYDIVQYDQLTALFIEAIKDLKAEIDELKAKLAE